MISRVPRSGGRGGLLVLCLAAGLLVGCTSRKGDGAERGSGTRPLVSSARASLQAILEAYRGWDLEAVLSHVDADFYPQYTLFRQSLYEDREQVERIQLDVVVDQEIASGDSIVLRTHWNRVHVPNATGVPVRTQGSVDWHFGRESGLLLDLRGQRPIAFN